LGDGHRASIEDRSLDAFQDSHGGVGYSKGEQRRENMLNGLDSCLAVGDRRAA